jgi:hypothetical protein
VYRATGNGSFDLVASTNALAWSDSGLANSTAYSYRVTAESAAGKGPASGTAASRTYDVVPPGRVRSLSATPGPGGTTVTWSPPAPNGGPPVAEYLVVIRAQCEGLVDITFCETSRSTVTGTSYQDASPGLGLRLYSVSAMNEVGAGAPTEVPGASSGGACVGEGVCAYDVQTQDTAYCPGPFNETGAAVAIAGVAFATANGYEIRCTEGPHSGFHSQGLVVLVSPGGPLAGHDIIARWEQRDGGDYPPGCWESVTVQGGPTEGVPCIFDPPNPGWESLFP